jgi:DNA-directed RNA polymerase delta subunit
MIYEVNVTYFVESESFADALAYAKAEGSDAELLDAVVELCTPVAYEDEDEDELDEDFWDESDEDYSDDE